MTTKERLHEIVDELSELEADDALRLIEARRSGEWWAQGPDAHPIELNAADTERFLDALDHPERFEAGVERLKASAAKYRGE